MNNIPEKFWLIIGSHLWVGVVLLSFLIHHQTVNAQPSEDVILTAEEQEWISEHPMLLTTNIRNFPPIDFILNGEAAGFSIDYINLAAKKVGLSLEYVDGVTWPEQLDMLRTKRLDLGHAIIQTKERDEFLHFTSPYIELSHVFFGRVGSEQINSLQDLEGKRIGAVKGTASAEFYKTEFPHLNVVEYDNGLDILSAIAADNIDLYYNNLAATNYIISKNFIPGVEVVGDNVSPKISGLSQFRMAVRADWPILVDILEKGMLAISEQEFLDISNKWLAAYQAETKINLSPEELNWLSENKIIRVAVDPTVAPFEFIDQSGNISGIAGSYLAEISKRLNVEFVWSGNNNWSEALNEIKNGDADLLSFVAPTDERRKFITFTENYITTTNMIFALDGGGVFRNIDGLNGHKVVLVSDFVINNLIKNDFPDLDVITVDTIVEALHLVATGEVDAYIGGILSSSYHIAAEGLTQIRVVGDTPYTMGISMGAHKDQPLLASAVQKALQSITPARKLEISREWLSLKIEPQTNYQVILGIITIAIVIVIFILARNYGLRGEVRRRKIIEKKLIKSQAKAEAGNIAKSQFIANMSHEMRTPMNAIIGFSDLILRDKDLKGENRKNLKIVKSSGDHLLSIINDILDISNIEVGKLKIQEEFFSPEQLIVEIYNMYRSQMEKKGLNYSVKLDDNIPNILFGDKKHIHQILVNLIGNAIKFTDKGGVFITGTIEQLSGLKSMLHINIRDTGRGIKQKNLEKIFEAFEQTDEGIKQIDGVGIGLTLSRSFARGMGGDITVNSHVGEGANIHLTIPVDTRKMEDSIENEEVGEINCLLPEYEMTRVLIVDDIEKDRRYLTALLDGAGFETRSCSNGEEAIEITQKWLPKIIIMDALMPIMSGSEAIVKIRKLSTATAIPIIVISASIVDKDVKSIISIGSNTFLTKPVLRQKLLLTIGKLLPIEYDYESVPHDDDEPYIPVTSDVIIKDKYPEDLITRMQAAVVELNIGEIEALIIEGEQHDKAIAKTLSALVNNFDWVEIERLLGE